MCQQGGRGRERRSLRSSIARIPRQTPRREKGEEEEEGCHHSRNMCQGGRGRERRSDPSALALLESQDKRREEKNEKDSQLSTGCRPHPRASVALFMTGTNSLLRTDMRCVVRTLWVMRNDIFKSVPSPCLLETGWGL
jgi:hypothetical protein